MRCRTRLAASESAAATALHRQPPCGDASRLMAGPGDAPALGLPRWAHIPGKTPEADRPPLDRAKRLLPSRFPAEVPAVDHVFRYGVALHDGGFFWEAHEIWEAVWKAAPMNGPDRLALQALIQLANAALKRRMARPAAAARLYELGAGLLAELRLRRPGLPASVAAGLDFEALAGAVSAEQASLPQPGSCLLVGPMIGERYMNYFSDST